VHNHSSALAELLGTFAEEAFALAEEHAGRSELVLPDLRTVALRAGVPTAPNCGVWFRTFRFGELVAWLDPRVHIVANSIRPLGPAGIALAAQEAAGLPPGSLQVLDSVAKNSITVGDTIGGLVALDHKAVVVVLRALAFAAVAATDRAARVTDMRHRQKK
jgi:hypothetical protein